jgi:hypothetical protein
MGVLPQILPPQPSGSIPSPAIWHSEPEQELRPQAMPFRLNQGASQRQTLYQIIRAPLIVIIGAEARTLSLLSVMAPLQNLGQMRRLHRR